MGVSSITHWRCNETLLLLKQKFLQTPACVGLEIIYHRNSVCFAVKMLLYYSVREIQKLSLLNISSCRRADIISLSS